MTPALRVPRTTSRPMNNVLSSSFAVAEEITSTLGIDSETVKALNELQENVPSPLSGNFFAGKNIFP